MGMLAGAKLWRRLGISARTPLESFQKLNRLNLVVSQVCLTSKLLLMPNRAEKAPGLSPASAFGPRLGHPLLPVGILSLSSLEIPDPTGSPPQRSAFTSHTSSL